MISADIIDPSCQDEIIYVSSSYCRWCWQGNLHFLEEGTLCSRKHCTV